MEHDFSKIRVPFIDNKIISRKADLFRNKFWEDSLPVDIEYIIDVKLKINIIPSPDLYKACNTDALIASNWKSLYIDKYKYLDERQQNRLRFSLAHEIGHFILHKDLYQNCAINDARTFHSFFNKISSEQYGYLEAQANKFANYLLLPREKLVVTRNKFLKKLEKHLKDKKMNEKMLNTYLSIPISKIFGVNEQPTEIALNDIIDSDSIFGKVMKETEKEKNISLKEVRKVINK